MSAFQRSLALQKHILDVPSYVAGKGVDRGRPPKEIIARENQIESVHTNRNTV